MNFVIRKMRQDDLEGATGVLSKWNMAPIAPSPEIPEPERSFIDIANSFVAEDCGRIVGVASYIVHSAELAETASHAVDPDYRGKGAGYALQVARLHELKQRSFRTVRTETDRPETVDWLIRKFGFNVIGSNRKKHLFSLVNADHWTVLELDLEHLEI